MEGLNIEAYDADSLRKVVRLFEYENKILKDKLKKAGISYEEVNPFEEKIESAEERRLFPTMCELLERFPEHEMNIIL